MKKSILRNAFLFGLFGLLFSLLPAQNKGLFVRVNGGFHLPAAGSAVNTMERTDTSGYSEQYIITTLGGGIPIEADLGYWFSEHLGFELGAQFHYGSTQTVRDLQTPNTTIQATAWTRQFRMAASFLLRSGGEDFRVYTRAGVIVPIVGATYLDIDADISLGNLNQRTITKYKNTGKFNLGFQGGIGVQLDVTDFLALNLELQGIEIRIPTNKREMYEAVRYNSDGSQDNLLANGEITEYDREINYHYTLDESHNSPLTRQNVIFDQPADAISYTSSYTSLGLNLGVMLTF